MLEKLKCLQIIKDIQPKLINFAKERWNNFPAIIKNIPGNLTTKLINAARIYEGVPIPGVKNQMKSADLQALLDTACYAGLAVFTSTSIMFNKNIPQDKKDFMVPQEWAEAFINIVSIFTLNKYVSNFSSNLIKKGKFHPKFHANNIEDLTKRAEIEQIVKKTPGLLESLNDLRKPEIIEQIIKGNLDEVKKSDKISTLLKSKPEVLETQVENIKKLHNNFKALGSFVGLAVALSIVMPFLVNKFATWYKNKYGSKLKSIPDKPASLNPLGAKPLTKNPLFEDFKTGKINFGERAKMAKTKAPAFTSYSSGLRI